MCFSLSQRFIVGHLALMIDVAPMAMVYFLVAIWSLGQLLNKMWFLALVSNLSIRVWPTQRLNSLGSNPYLKNSLFPIFSPLFLYCDNLNTTYLAANLVLHSWAKHVEIDYHFIRERVLQEIVDVRFLPFEDQVANILTKALSAQHFLHFRSKLIVIYLSICLRGDVK